MNKSNLKKDKISELENKEEPVEIPDAELTSEEKRGSRILTMLILAVAAINIIIIAIFREAPVAVNVAGLTLSVLVLAGIIVLGLWWKSKPKPVPVPVVNVTSITASVGTPCTPNGSSRIVQQPGTPASTPWTIVRTFTQQSLVSKAKKYVPSAKYLTYGFIDVTRTLNYTCQKQDCNNGVWANTGSSYACNVVENKTFQVYGGPVPEAPLQAWTDEAIRQSFSSGYYQ